MLVYDSTGKLVELKGSEWNTGHLPPGYYASPYQLKLATGIVVGPGGTENKVAIIADANNPAGGFTEEYDEVEYAPPPPVAPPPPPPPPLPDAARVQPLATPTQGNGQPQPTAPAVSPYLAQASPNIPPQNVSPLFDPTHRRVGTDAAGNPVYRLVDEMGNVVQWIEVNGQTANLVGLGPVASAPSYVSPAPVISQAAPALAPSQPVAGPGAAPSVSPYLAQASPNIAPENVSPFFDPTHRHVGTDAAGNPVFRLVDELGNVVQWTEIAGQTANLVGLGPVQNVPAYVSPVGAPAPGTLPSALLPSVPGAPSNANADLLKLAALAGYFLLKH